MARKTIRTTDTPERLDRRILRARSDAERAFDRVTRESDRADAGWGNIMMGLSDVTRDKREYHVPISERHTYGELMDLYRSNDLAARTCDRPAEDMTREGFETTIDGEKNSETMADDVDGVADELEVLGSMSEALRKSAAAGGAAILLGVVDKVGDAALPIDEDRLERIDFLTVLDSRELYPTSYYADPFAPKFGLPRTYRVQPAFLTGGYAPGPNEPISNSGDGRGSGGRPFNAAFLQVHETRIIRFPGVNVNRWQMRETLGWGDSRLERPWKILRNHDISWDAASYLLTDFAQAVFKMDGLKEAVASGNVKMVQDRAAIMELQRSFMRMVMIGKDDEFERKPTPLGGLADILDRFAKRYAAAADIPVEILYGESPAGLNATGSNTVRSYYDRIKARQKNEILKPLRRALYLIMRSKKGPTGGNVPKSWSATFRPLWQPTEAEIASAYKDFAAGDASNVTNQIVEPEEVAISRYGGRKFGTTIRIDTKSREKFLRENPPGEKTEKEGAEEEAAIAMAKQKAAEAAAATGRPPDGGASGGKSKEAAVPPAAPTK